MPDEVEKLKKEVNALKTQLKAQNKRISELENEIFEPEQVEVATSTKATPQAVFEPQNSTRGNYVVGFIVCVVAFWIAPFAWGWEGSLVMILSVVIGIVMLYKIATYPASGVSVATINSTAETQQSSKEQAEPASQKKSKSIPKKKDLPKEFEMFLGMSLLSKIGMIVLILGIIFFLKYSMDQGWVSVELRIIMGMVAGVVLMILGHVFERKKYGRYARTFTGGGSLVLYATVIIANVLYSMFDYFITLLLTIIISAVTLTLAVKYRSQVIAYFGLIGVYFLPVAINIRMADPIFMFIYYFIITITTFLFVRKTDLAYYAFAAGSYIAPLFVGFDVHILILFFYFVTTNLLHLLIVHKTDKKFIMYIMTVGGFVIPSIAIAALQNIDANIYLIYAAIFVAMAYYTFYKKSWTASTFIPVGAVTLTVPFIFFGDYSIPFAWLFIFFLLFLTVAIAYIFNKRWLHYVVGVVAVLMPSFMMPDVHLELNYVFAGYLLFTNILLLHMAHRKDWPFSELIAIIMTVPYLGFLIDFEIPGQSFILLATFFVTYLISHMITIFLKEPRVTTLIAMVINALAMFGYGNIILLENDYLADYKGLYTLALAIIYFLGAILFYKRFQLKDVKALDAFEGSHKPIIIMLGVGLALLTLVFPLQFDDELLPVSWLAFAFALVFIGFKIKHAKLRAISSVLYLLSLYLVFLNWVELYPQEALIGSDSLMQLFAIIITAFTFYLYRKNKEDIRLFEKYNWIVLSIILALMVWFYTTFEVDKLFDGVTEMMTMTLVWAIYGTVLMVIGFTRNSQLVRIYGLIVFSVTLLKLFILDIWELDRIYRITAFIGLGILLLLSSFLYNRFKRLIVG